MPTAAPSKRRAATPPPPPGISRISSRVKIDEPEAPAKKDEIPIIPIEGDTMKRFNEAKASLKEAEQTIKDLEPFVKKTAMEHIFKHNCDPNCLHPLTSVKLQDFKKRKDFPPSSPEHMQLGEITRVSFTERYNSCDTAQVENAFASFQGRDVNDYVTETLAATFDSKIFLDTDGNFDATIYNKFRAAIERVSAELGLKNPDGSIKSPLKTQRVLITKEDFHQRRFKDFDVEENIALTRVLPNTIQCAPVRTK